MTPSSPLSSKWLLTLVCRQVSRVNMAYNTAFAIFLAFLPSVILVSVPMYTLNDANKIPAVALGTWLGNNTQPSSDELEKAVAWAIEAGYRHIDTASAYRVEDQVGRAINAKIRDGFSRNIFFITTKLWNDRHAREEVVPALRESLAALRLDYVDLYLIHWPIGQFFNGTYDYTDYLETWRGMMDAKKAGLTTSIGVSNFNQQMIDRIIDSGLETPAVLQVEINLNLQQPSLLSYCKDKGIVVMGYTPFGSLFPHKVKPDSPPPRVDDDTLVTIANNHNKTVTQIVLRYLVELGVIPIPKSLTKSRIEQNIDVFDFQLSDDEKSTLRRFDKSYRTIPQHKWLDHPYYPFEKA